MPIESSALGAAEAKRAPGRVIYAGIFLVSAATLLLQVTLTRIFSVSIWYHFAFLVVSIALFGFGASGVALSLLSPDPAPGGEKDRRRLALAPLLFAAATLTGHFGGNAIPFSPFRIAQEPAQVLYLLAVDLLLTAPFFFSGMTIALVLRTYPRRAGALYAWDLVGAAIGALLLFAALPRLGAPGAVVLASALGCGAAVLLASPVPGRRVARLAAAALVLHVPFLIAPGLLPDVRIDASKPLTAEVKERGGRVTYTGWNALSRIDVVERPDTDPMILIDSAAMTSLARPVAENPVNLNDVSTLAYRLEPGASALIIGSGGGMDVQNALGLGARSVTCVEINPTIIDLVTGAYAPAIGNVFSDPRVRLVEDEGRSYVDRTSERYEIVQLTLIDTWAAGVSGAYTLTENYLYTVEAFRAYIESLAPDGLLSITRWYYEAPRLATVAKAALESMRIPDPGRHVLVVQRKIACGFLLKRSPFTPEEVAGARAFAAEVGGEILYDPTRPRMATFYDLLFGPTDTEQVLASQPADVSPVTDDSPFFFQMARWRNVTLGALKDYAAGNFLVPLVLPVGQIALLSAFGIGLLLSIALLAVPLAAGRVPRQGRMRWLGYFLGLGLGFIAVEVVLIQRFTLFLGHPTYSVTMVLFAILLFSGLGSAWSGGRSGEVAALVGPIAVLLPAAILLSAFAVPPLTRALIGLPLPARLLLAVAFIAPVAFLMGMPFPVGIRVAGGADPALVPWAWAANGCASVVGSVSAVLGAMTWGFTAVLAVAAGVYVVVLVSLARSRATFS